MVKIQKKLLCAFLSFLITAISLICYSANYTAAQENTVYFQAPDGWSNVTCYAWKNAGGSENENAAWPGKAMQKIKGNIYQYLLQDSYSKIIFSNGGDNKTQTNDLDYPGNSMMYVYELKQWTEYTGQAVTPVPPAAEEKILDPSFELSNGFWNYMTGMSQSADKARTGSYSAKSNIRGLNSVTLFASKTISVTPHTDYRLSGYIYRGDGSGWGYLDMNDIQGELQLRASAVSKWQYVTGLWNSGNNTSVQIRGVTERDYHQTTSDYQGITADIWFDDISFMPETHPSYSEDSPSISGSAPSWVMENEDIKMTVQVESDKQYITGLVNKSNGINWISGAARVPLLSKVSGKDITWRYENAQVTANDGKTVTLNFSSASPALRLKSVWEIKDAGPVYHYSELLNDTGGQIIIGSEDVTAADALLQIPNSVTAYRFNRSRFNNGLDSQFTTGVLTQKVDTNMYLRSSIENSWEKSTGVLPFELLQADNHGLYFGYDWSYGEILMQTQKNVNTLKLSACLGEVKEDITRDSGEAFTVPGVFYGTYSGTPDDGSNNMKKWFWNNRMTKSLRDNKNEPAIELHVPGYSENYLTSFLHKYDVASWGVGMLKMDYWWTVPTTPGDANSGFDSYKEQQWQPDPVKWPNGMTYAKIAKNIFPGMKTSLYMCDTYQGVDIGTKEGRTKQLAALSDRIENWEIDTWRSDFDVEAPNSYASHEGLLYILDTLIDKYDNFRYEHCSAGGALKDFSTLGRMTFMTMEDSGGALNHRMAFYSNSYMINPLQLKFDLGFDWTSPQDAPYIAQNPKEWAYYVLRSAMMGSMMAGSVGREMTTVEIDAAKDCYALYNSKQREILRGADVYHILPMPDGVNWDGMQFYNNKINKGSVFLFKNSESGGSDGTQKTVYFDGLKDSAVFTLTFEDRPALNCIKTGKELMENGITVTGMNKVYDSEIIWIERTGGSDEDYTLGDVDNSGKIDLGDVLMVQKHLAKFTTLNTTQLLAADVTKDGTVSIDDVVRIQKKIAFIIDEF